MLYNELMWKSVRVRFDWVDLVLFFFVAFGALGFVSSTFHQPADALEQSSYVTASLGAAIELNIQPVVTGVNDPSYITANPLINNGSGQGSVIVVVSSNNPTGYSVLLNMQNDDKNLNYLVSSDVTNYTNNGTVLDTSSNVIAPISSGTSLSPNTWGFALATSPNVYRAVPLKNQSGYNIVAEAETPNQGQNAGTDTITVTFGAQIDLSLLASIYSNTVLFTATNNSS